MIIIVGEIIDDKYHSVFNAASITLVSMLAIAVLVVGVGFKGALKRQAAEKSARSTVAASCLAPLDRQPLTLLSFCSALHD